MSDEQVSDEQTSSSQTTGEQMTQQHAYAERAFEPTVFPADQFAVLSQAVDRMIPGSVAVGAAVYLDRIAADLPPEIVSHLAEVAAAVVAAPDASAVLAVDDFGLLRALSIEAYYSDFVAPGSTAPGAWEAIGFDSAPQAQKATQDWSVLSEAALVSSEPGEPGPARSEPDPSGPIGTGPDTGPTEAGLAEAFAQTNTPEEDA